MYIIRIESELRIITTCETYSELSFFRNINMKKRKRLEDDKRRNYSQVSKF